MEDEEKNDINKIVDFLDETDEFKVNKDEHFKFYDESDQETIKDYSSLQTLKALKQNPKYYFSKWTVILNHLINLDLYFYYLEEETFTKEGKSAKEKYNFYKRKKKNKNYKKMVKDSSSFNQTVESIYIKFRQTSSETSSNRNSTIQLNQNNITNTNKNDLEEFKLNYLRKSFKILGFEEIEGISFEDYVKRTLYLMLLILKIDYYEFLNPHNVLYKELMNISKNKIEEDFAENYEIDLVINNFKLQDLETLLSKYPKHFLFKEQLKLKEINNNKINIVSEITTDLIKNIDYKSKQLTKYINVLNFFRKFEINKMIEASQKNTINSFQINPFNPNIFIIITNGSYFLIQFVVNILMEIYNKKVDEKEIEILIDNRIKNEKSILINNIIKNKKNISEKIKKVYYFFNKLRINQISHCLFYIGEESGTEYEDNVLSIFNYKQIKNNDLQYDDIYINYKIKNLIHDFIQIKDNFCSYLEKFGQLIIQDLIINQKNALNKLFQSFSIKKEDLLPIDVLINKDENTDIDLNEVNDLNFSFKFLNSSEINEILNKFNNKDSKVIFIVDSSQETLFKVQEVNTKIDLDNNYIYLSQTIQNLEKSLILPLKLISKTIIKMHCYKPKKIKNSFESNAILDYQKLCSKIKNEFDVKIEKSQINNLFSIKIEEAEQMYYFDNIKKNINAFYDLLSLKDKEKKNKKIEDLKLLFEKRIPILEENLKAAILSNYIYYSFIPDLKYQQTLKKFNIKNDN